MRLTFKDIAPSLESDLPSPVHHASMPRLVGQPQRNLPRTPPKVSCTKPKKEAVGSDNWYVSYYIAVPTPRLNTKI